MKKKTEKKIAGDLLEGTTLLRSPELKMISYLAPKVPNFISTYHLTISSLFFSFMMVGSGWLAGSDRRWLWLAIGISLVQFVADALDGEVGRRRNSGLVKWGFYIDHFLDYVFMCAIAVAHMLVWPKDFLILVGLMGVMGGFFFHEALSCVLFGKYNVRGYNKIGTTEIRFGVILVDIYAIVFKPERVSVFFGIMLVILWYALARQVVLQQRVLWNMDLAQKKKKN